LDRWLHRQRGTMRNPFRKKAKSTLPPIAKNGEVRINKQVNGLGEVRYVVEVYGSANFVDMYGYTRRTWRTDMTTTDIVEACARRDELCREFLENEWTPDTILLEGCE